MLEGGVAAGAAVAAAAAAAKGCGGAGVGGAVAAGGLGRSDQLDGSVSAAVVDVVVVAATVAFASGLGDSRNDSVCATATGRDRSSIFSACASTSAAFGGGGASGWCECCPALRSQYSAPTVHSLS